MRARALAYVHARVGAGGWARGRGGPPGAFALDRCGGMCSYMHAYDTHVQYIYALVHTHTHIHTHTHTHNEKTLTTKETQRNTPTNTHTNTRACGIV